MQITKRIVPIALALTIAALVSVETPAAGPKAAKATIDFFDVDANKDGKVSPEEVAYIDDLRASFEVLDANHDQALTPIEYSHWSRASKTAAVDPATLPGGSAGSQHMPKSN
jgi:hypothetical protein